MLPRSQRIWLLSLYGLVLLMVIVGGTTRLTGSGLSMVEWRPLMGTLPPLNEFEWQQTFASYKTSPQYQQVNHWMQLSDFQRIFLWEYVHRLLGRLVGVVAVIPWLYFLVRRRFSRRLAIDSGIAIVLGGAQGVLGWFMVKSGLVDRPEVSHFRLAAHFLLAVGVGHWLLWLLLRPGAAAPSTKAPVPVARGLGLVVVMAGLWLLQSVYGAFMAGTRAGYLFQSYPDMNGAYGPGAFRHAGFLEDILYHAPMIHWLHRSLAIVLLLFAAYLWWSLRPISDAVTQRARHVFAAAMSLQFLLGVLTVVWGVPVLIAVAHQVMAYLLLSAILWLFACLRAVARKSLNSEARRGDVSLSTEEVHANI